MKALSSRMKFINLNKFRMLKFLIQKIQIIFKEVEKDLTSDNQKTSCCMCYFRSQIQHKSIESITVNNYCNVFW